MHLDKLDKKLLSAVSVNARAQLATLAKHCNTSKQVIKYRLERLEKNKIITRYVSVINPAALGYQVYTQFVRLMTSDPKKTKEFITSLCKNPAITWVAHCTGNYDLIFAVYAKNAVHFYDIVKQIGYEFTGYLQFRSTVISVYEAPLALNFLNETIDTKAPEMDAQVPYIELDTVEKKLLQVLDRQARLPIVTLAKKVGTTTDIAHRRLKKLMNTNVIQGFVAEIDTALLGYSQYMLLVNLGSCGKKRRNTFFSYIRNHPNMLYLIECIGEWNVSITLIAKDNKEFNSIILDLKEHFSDIMSRYRTLIIFETPKYTHLPPL